MRRALLLLGLLACSKASTPAPQAPDQFLRATPIIDQGPPVISPAGGEEIAASDSFDSPAMATVPSFDPVAPPPAPVLPTASTKPSHAIPRAPSAVIAEANAQASQGPDPAGFTAAVMTYTFVAGGIYHVYTAPEHVTAIGLEPGEDLMGDPVAGDTLQWRLAVGASAVQGVPRKYVFIKPTRPGLATNLTLNTNRRTYFLELESLESNPMVAVQWHYPSEDVRVVALPPTGQGKPRNASRPVAPGDAATLHWDYAIKVVDGHPPWKPSVVFDDGAKTYIRFDPSVLHGEAPALFVIQHDALQLVNYRVKGDLYVVDRIFHAAELRLGQDDQDVIRITRK
jgi:P-type conjugative transfer protein TrbG